MNNESLRERCTLLEQKRRTSPAVFELFAELSRLLERLEDYDKLLQLLEEGIGRWPEHVELLMLRARIHSILGDFHSSRNDYLLILARQPDHVAAICALVMLGDDDDAGGIDRVNSLLKRERISKPETLMLGYARARLLENMQLYPQAFECYREANALGAAAGGMDIAAKQRGARAVIDDVSPERVRRFSGRGNISDRPVFIVGMPRSGTTLTEQVIASHPLVHAAGEQLVWGNVLARLVRSAPPHGDSMIEAINELDPGVWSKAGDEYLKNIGELGSGVLRITDKLPANYGLLPYIRLVFPRARIIHLRRDPLATICSCIRQNFSAPSLAFSVEDWARFYGIYQALMEKWQPILGSQMLTVDYESLVSDFPSKVREIIAFLGLDWNEACLHPELNRRAVRTASLQQVRNVVHTEAIGAWGRYNDQLKLLEPIIEQSKATVTGSLSPSSE
jgi:tetratricopeptide (TPR) repeat protein